MQAAAQLMHRTSKCIFSKYHATQIWIFPTLLLIRPDKCGLALPTLGGEQCESYLESTIGVHEHFNSTHEPETSDTVLSCV